MYTFVYLCIVICFILFFAIRFVVCNWNKLSINGKSPNKYLLWNYYCLIYFNYYITPSFSVIKLSAYFPTVGIIKVFFFSSSLVCLVCLRLCGLIYYIPTPHADRGQTGHTGMEQHFKLRQFFIFTFFNGCSVSALVILNAVSSIQIPWRTWHYHFICSQLCVNLSIL